MISTCEVGLAVAVVGDASPAPAASVVNAALAELRDEPTGQYLDRTMLQVVGRAAALVAGSSNTPRAYR